MTMIIRTVCAEPKPGHEFNYYLAMKHRHIASGLMLEETRKPWRMLVRRQRYNRLFHLWCAALDRMREHGQDRVRVF